MLVYVLLINHKHGINTYVFRHEESALDALAAYAREWWTVDHGWSPDAPMTREDFDALSDSEAIEAYFEATTDEDFTLDSATLAEG